MERGNPTITDLVSHDRKEAFTIPQVSFKQVEADTRWARRICLRRRLLQAINPRGRGEDSPIVDFVLSALRAPAPDSGQHESLESPFSSYLAAPRDYVAAR